MERQIQANVSGARFPIEKMTTLLKAATMVENEEVMKTLIEKSIQEMDNISNRLNVIEMAIAPKNQDRT